MKRRIVQTTAFEDIIKSLIAKNKLNQEDFEDFKKSLIESPEQGAVVVGTGGVRKARLKSATKGKSGGFRVCYLNLEDKLILFLLSIYQKNEKDNLSQSEKAELKQLTDLIKKKVKNE